MLPEGSEDMAQRENQRVVISKRLLKEGLLRLLETEKLERVNVSALCAEAGINRATFYRHYSCPRDVLVDLEKDIVRDMGKDLKKPNTEAEARRYLEDICTYLYDHAELMRVLIRCRTDEDLVDLLWEFDQRLYAMQGQIKELEQLDRDSLRLTSTFFCSGSYYLLRRWLTEDIRKTPKEVAQLLYGIISTRGRAWV